MSQDLVCCQTLAGVNIQHLSNQVLGKTGDSQPVARVNVVLALSNPAQDVFRRVLRTCSKWCLSGKHREQENTQAPYVTSSVIALKNIYI